MHIPDGYLSPATCAATYAIVLPFWVVAFRRVGRALHTRLVPLLALFSAFCFVIMMFNLPLPGGTSGHAVGVTLAAIVLGPWAAIVAISMALLIQALFFGDGGILAFGANCFNMAFVLPFTGYAVYQLARRHLKSPSGEYIAAGLGAYAGINAAALVAAIEFGVQPLLFTDAAGQALYCPYPLWISVPAMMVGHLTIFGLAEVVFTTAVLAYLHKTSPDLFQSVRMKTNRALYGLIAALIVCTPLGLLAAGTAWGEWDPEELADQDFLGTALGYTPAGMEQGFSFDALFPDYAIAGLPDAFGYILSALIGTALLVILFKMAAPLFASHTDYGDSLSGR